MVDIRIQHNPSEDKLRELGVSKWPLWTKEASEFPWTYDTPEVCYFLEGEVIVTPTDGEPVKMGVGDLVEFPSGMSCKWKILRDVTKNYRFG